MLDKATVNIEHKEVWPLKNFLEDLADAEMEFKQMQFEHFVASEVGTIELATDLTETLGRLRLLHRIAYLKIRGNDWVQIRTMYAAIVRSIEIGDCSWESNFDRFESIVTCKREEKRKAEKTQRKKDWFCRDYNRLAGCRKTGNYWGMVGTGTQCQE